MGLYAGLVLSTILAGAAALACLCCWSAYKTSISLQSAVKTHEYNWTQVEGEDKDVSGDSSETARTAFVRTITSSGTTRPISEGSLGAKRSAELSGTGGSERRSRF
jgi:hypothetical protein